MLSRLSVRVLVRAGLPLVGLLLSVCALVGCAHSLTAVNWPRSTLDHSDLPTGMPWNDTSDLPNRTEILAGQLVIHADFPLAGQHRLVRDLETLRLDVSQKLGLPISDELVHLYVFERPDRYDAFAAKHFPNFPVRRAFFVETDTTLSVFAPWQDRIAEDLRHETTHGYVHAVVPTVPLWLDEGIAEFFEIPRGEQGLHRDHIAHLSGRMLEGTCRIDLPRLESLESAGELSQDHYAESWAWVHWMLETTAPRRTLLQNYLADLRRDGKTAPLSARLTQLEGSPSVCTASVRAHIESVAALPQK